MYTQQASVFNPLLFSCRSDLESCVITDYLHWQTFSVPEDAVCYLEWARCLFQRQDPVTCLLSVELFKLFHCRCTQFDKASILLVVSLSYGSSSSDVGCSQGLVTHMVAFFSPHPPPFSLRAQFPILSLFTSVNAVFLVTSLVLRGCYWNRLPSDAVDAPSHWRLSRWGWIKPWATRFSCAHPCSLQ